MLTHKVTSQSSLIRALWLGGSFSAAAAERSIDLDCKKVNQPSGQWSENRQTPSGWHGTWFGNLKVISTPVNYKIFPTTLIFTVVGFYNILCKCFSLWETWLTNDKVGSSMNCFKLRLFPLTCRETGSHCFISHAHHTVWTVFLCVCVCVCVSWPVGVCRSCGGRHTHCLLTAEIQTHTEDIKKKE